VSVSLPKWRDVTGWATKDPQVLAHLKTGYPRFYIHPFIERLATLLLQLLIKSKSVASSVGEIYGEESRATAAAMLFPHASLGISCRDYLQRAESNPSNKLAIFTFQVDFAGEVQNVHSGVAKSTSGAFQSLCVVVFPHDLSKEAKMFWQHTGFGVTSRHALYWLERAPCLREVVASIRQDGKLPLDDAKQAATKIKNRIAELLSSESSAVKTQDVFLYPSGMSAIAHSASALQELYKGSSDSIRVAVFG
jgi:cystathionine gamma-synthase